MHKIVVNTFCHFIKNKEKRKIVRQLLLNGASLSCQNNGDTDNKNDIIFEYLTRIIDVENLPKARGNLKIIQDCSLAILNQFSKLCEKHNLKFWLSCGTLIGYVRHNGFIPWDDDLDVGMLREDYEKLLPLLEKEFKNDGFYYRTGEIVQLYYKNTPAWVDIFPFDQGDTVELPTGEKYDKFVKILNETKATIVFDQAKWRAHQQPVTDEYLNHCYQVRDTELYPNKNKKGFLFYGIETGVQNRICFSYDDIFPLKPADFLGVKAYIPKDTDYYCFLEYGDYMNLPRNFTTMHGECLANFITKENYKECRELIEKYSPTKK